jgi:hypothetical protein
MMAKWGGHKLATSAVLYSLSSAATRGGSGFSVHERVLFTACEFWAAARNSVLLEHLSLEFDEPESMLRAAEQSFARIGLSSVANVLREGLLDLTRTDQALQLAQVALNIEKALACIKEPVDEILADFALHGPGIRTSKS